MYVCVSGFFFFKQKTAYDMRISDWSSDVCSSDLGYRRPRPPCSARGARHDAARRRSDREIKAPNWFYIDREGHQLIEGHAVLSVDVVQLRRNVGELEALLHDRRGDHEGRRHGFDVAALLDELLHGAERSEEHTSELQ